MSRAWPPPPDWIELDVTPRRVRRGERVTITPRLREDGHDRHQLGLVCVAHHAGVAKTAEVGDPGGRFRADRQTRVFETWSPLGPHAVDITVPADAPYSYEGDLLSFYWGVWLCAPRAEAPDGYVPLAVAP